LNEQEANRMPKNSLFKLNLVQLDE